MFQLKQGHTCQPGTYFLCRVEKCDLVLVERRVWQIVKSWIQEEKCGFRPGCGTFDGAWEFAQSVFVCFMDFEKAYNHVPRSVLQKVFQK